jgi:hypothetical protein
MNRIADAEAQRNCCDRGTAARMHYNGLLAILRQKSKKHPNHFEKKIKIYENKYSSLLKEATIYSSLIQPFEDILKAGKLTFFTLLSDLWMNLKVFTTFDIKEIEKIKSEYEQNQKKLQKKWDPILKRVDAGLMNPDLQVMFMLYSPTLWANKYAFDWSKSKIKKVFSEENETEESYSNKSKKNTKSSKKDYDAFYQNFKSIFMESLILNKNILMEKSEDFSIDQFLSNFVKNNRKDLEEMNENIVQFIKPLDLRVKNIEKLIKDIENTKNYDELKQTIENFNFLKEDSSVDYEKTRKEILISLESAYQKSISELIDSKDFKNNLIGKKFLNQYGIDVEKSKNLEIESEKIKKDLHNIKEINVEDIKKSANEQFISTFKKGLIDKFIPDFEELKNETSKVIKNELGFLQEAKESDLKEIFNDFPDFLNSLISIKNYYKI